VRACIISGGGRTRVCGTDYARARARTDRRRRRRTHKLNR